MLFLTFLCKTVQFYSVILAWISSDQNFKCENTLKSRFFRIWMHRFPKLLDWISPNQILITRDKIDFIFRLHPVFFQILAWTNSSQICDQSVWYYVISFRADIFTLACHPMLFLTFLCKIVQFHAGILAWIYSGQNLSVKMHLKSRFFRIWMHRFHKLLDWISPNQILITYDNTDFIIRFHPVFFQILAWTNSSQICDKSVWYYVISFRADQFN